MSHKNKLAQSQNKGSVREQQVLYQRSAPLPTAAELEHYNNIQAGLADRIVALAERQAGHRQVIEKWHIKGDVIRSGFGLLFGFIVAMSFIGGSVFLLFNGIVVEGLAMGIGLLVSLVGVFIYGDKAKRKDLAVKRDQLTDRSQGRN